MSAFLPAPLTIVVFSFSIITFLARPSMFSVTFSSLMPRSSLMAGTAGQDRDILQHGLAAITEAGRFDGRAMFSNLFSSSISLATVTPSLVMRGAPNDLSSTTCGPWVRA
jgi:hypothetical protein